MMGAPAGGRQSHPRIWHPSYLRPSCVAGWSLHPFQHFFAEPLSAKSDIHPGMSFHSCFLTIGRDEPPGGVFRRATLKCSCCRSTFTHCAAGWTWRSLGAAGIVTSARPAEHSNKIYQEFSHIVSAASSNCHFCEDAQRLHHLDAPATAERELRSRPAWWPMHVGTALEAPHEPPRGLRSVASRGNHANSEWPFLPTFGCKSGTQRSLTSTDGNGTYQV